MSVPEEELQQELLGVRIEDIPVVFNISTLAKIIGCSDSTAYTIAKSPGFPVIDLPGCSKRVYKVKFLEWLDRVSEPQQ